MNNYRKKWGLLMKSETNKKNVAFNRIGIDNTLDWARIQKLLKIGVFASILAMIGDLMLGWGVQDETLPGFFRMFSSYTGTSDKQLFVVALLGLFGMTLEGLSFFGIYRLIAPKSPRYANHYRSGIIGYLLFGPCGFHVTVCGIVFLYKHLLAAGVAQPEELLSTYMHYFFLPAFILFWIFFFVLEGAHIIAFARGKTPLPKWSFIFPCPSDSFLQNASMSSAIIPLSTPSTAPGYILPAYGHSPDYSSSLLRRPKSLGAIPNLTVKTCKRTHKTAVTRMPVKGCIKSVVFSRVPSEYFYDYRDLLFFCQSNIIAASLE